MTTVPMTGRAHVVVGMAPEIIDVWWERKCDRYYKFTSPHVPGLFVVVEDYIGVAEINQEIQTAIASLVKADFGYDVTVRREKTCSIYREITSAIPEPNIIHYSVSRTTS